MYEIRCKDVGFDCPGVVVGKTRDEVLGQAAEHARTAHGVTVTPELADRVRGLIREQGAPDGKA